MKRVPYNEITTEILIDVRSPKEYAKDHVPGAINLPLFTDEERHIVGLLYKQQGRDEAIIKGSKFYGDKVPSFLKTMQQYKDKQIVVYCWRGGMRSETIASLFASVGYNVKKLQGGYKAYRAWVRKRFDDLQVECHVVHGLTGVGKTEKLQELNFLDLEACAGHKGSKFGHIGMQPVTQKMFESRLLQHMKPTIIVEGESRRIGDLFIPEPLWNAMKKGKHYTLTAPLQERVDRIMRDYGAHINELINVTKTLRQPLSKKRITEICELFTTDPKQAITILLTEYYDVKYNTGVHDEYDWQTLRNILKNV